MKNCASQKQKFASSIVFKVFSIPLTVTVIVWCWTCKT